MHEDDVRARAETLGEGLVAGDVEAAINLLSTELRRNLGEVVAMLPVPASEVTIESIARTASGYAVVLQAAGASEDIRLETRWKDRDGIPTIVEVSHLSRAERAPAPDIEGDATGEGTEGAGPTAVEA